MLIKRELQPLLEKSVLNREVVSILYGPRQAGKTTLLKELMKTRQKVWWVNGDDLGAQEIFSQARLEFLKEKVGDSQWVVIDEAQRIENIGLSLKLIHDHLPAKLVVSGSASFELASKINEPLTGRTETFWLYPLSLKEVELERVPEVTEAGWWGKILRFGLYPRIWRLVGEENKQRYLEEMVDKYLYHDLLSFEKVRKPKLVVDLLRLLAFQVGSEVSVNELASRLAISRQTVESYLDLLEKMFVLVRLGGFSRNLRREIYRSAKYYFVDVGLRNALVRDWRELGWRNDVGQLWENLMVMEIIKRYNNQAKRANFYFWRTYNGQEIDLVVEEGGKLKGYEFKWNERKKAKKPKLFLETYPSSKFAVINRKNWNMDLSF